MGGIPVSATIPPKISELLSLQEEEIHKLLRKISQKQQEFVIRNYVTALLESTFSRGLEVNEEELLDYMSKHFLKKEEALERTTKYSNELETRLNTLMVRFNGGTRGNNIELEFTCDNKQKWTIPFSVSQEGDEYDFVVHGIAIPEENQDEDDEEHECLKLVIQNRGESSEIKKISTQKTACPVPQKKAGTCLLSVSEQIARALKVPVISLEDGSAVRCKKSGEFADLGTIKWYQEGKSWYEKHGYQPRHPELYTEKLRDLMNYPLSGLIDHLSRFTKEGDKPDIHDYLFEVLKEFHKDARHKTLREFMSWLWHHDCAGYVRIDAYIKQYNPELPIWKLFPTNTRMDKKLD